jgi:hypothetical protein
MDRLTTAIRMLQWMCLLHLRAAVEHVLRLLLLPVWRMRSCKLGLVTTAKQLIVLITLSSTILLKLNNLSSTLITIKLLD